MTAIKTERVNNATQLLLLNFFAVDGSHNRAMSEYAPSQKYLWTNQIEKPITTAKDNRAAANVFFACAAYNIRHLALEIRR